MMIAHHFCDGVYAKETYVDAGYMLVQHKHEHSHLSILAVGKVELVVDGEKSIIEAPACIQIEAGKHHGIKALTPVAWYCIHKTDCTDESKVDEVLIQPIDKQDFDSVLNTLKE